MSTIDKDEIRRITLKHMEEWSKKHQEPLKKEYLDMKNLKIILIDFIPYEQKEEMIQGLRNLFEIDEKTGTGIVNSSPFNKIPDIKKSGFGGFTNLGIIFNSDISWEPLFGIKRVLPKPFLSLQIYLGQVADFSYYIVYLCSIKEEFYNKDIKDIFIHTEDLVPNENEMGSFIPRGPKLEPTIREYQKNMEKFLKGFSSGLYLNEDSKAVSCPNIKIISVKKVDFTSFEKWEREHLQFLTFLGFTSSYSKYNNFLIGFLNEQTFEKFGVNAGMLFLASEEDFTVKNSGPLEYEITRNVDVLIANSVDLMPLFLSTYWANYQLNVYVKELDEKVNTTLESLIHSEGISQITSIYKDLIEINRNFDSHFINERSNIKILEEKIQKSNIASSASPLKVGNREDNIFEDMHIGSQRILETENHKMEYLKSRFESSFRYCENFTNMNLNISNINLQESMNKLTKRSIYIAIFALIISISLSGISIYITYVNYQRTHPDGEYIVNVDLLGYDEPTHSDHYRITITYQGRGETKYLRLSVGIVGINPTYTSIVNLEVMEPNTILARNYIDNLIGWVDYSIKRSVSLNQTNINIMDFSSDVDVIIIDNTGT